MSTRAIRILMGLAVLASLLWGGYWFAGSRALDMAVSRVLGSGGPLSAQSHSISGFPNRFDLTLTEPRLAQNGTSWRAPFVQLFALTYRPHHAVLVMANEQQITTPDGTRIAISSGDLRASVVMRPSERLGLDRAALVGQSLLLNAEIIGLGRHSLTLEDLRLAIRSGSAAAQYELALEIEGMSLDPGLMASLDPQGLLPHQIQLLRFDAGVAFDRPLDLDVLRGPQPRMASLTLTGARMAGDGMRLDLEMRLSPDALGRLSGEARLHVTGWALLLERLERAGILSPEQISWITLAIPGMTDPGNPERITLPLTAREGTLYLGPLPLIELPLLQLPALR